MEAELSGILEHVDVIQSLDLDDVPPTTHVLALENVMRDDVPRPSLPVEEALREAPEVVEGRFAVVKFEP
jgi:aspartyl-tRNA(Asn)/glutamyl-tRNA(Gln) amidotransferase subunit C